MIDHQNVDNGIFDNFQELEVLVWLYWYFNNDFMNE